MVTEAQPIAAVDGAALADARIPYLLVQVNDLARARAFYEGVLGLRVVDEEPGAVFVDVGQACLWLKEVADPDPARELRYDDSCDIVFLVDDAARMRAALERRGVDFEHRRTYSVGAVIDFYDPDGHRLMLYEPSEQSLTTPVEGKIRELWASSGRGSSELIGPAAGEVPDLEEAGLDGKPLVYFFLFIKEAEEAPAFYEGKLGLRVLQRSHCCNDGCPDEIEGVMKYEAGGFILSTHHLHGHHAVLDDHGKPYGARDYEPDQAKGVSPVFHVTEIEDAVEELRDRGVEFETGIVRSRIGATAAFDAPSGHRFYLYEPSAEALALPRAAKLEA